MDDKEYPKARSRSPLGDNYPVKSEKYWNHVRKL